MPGPLTRRKLFAHGPRLMRFGAVGAVGATIDFSIFALLIGAGAPPVLANIPSFMTANAAAYLLHARVTFRRAGERAQISFGGYARFFAAYVFSLLLSTAAIALLAHRIGPLPAKVVATGIAGCCNYLSGHFLVFRHSAENKGAGRAAESA